MMRWPVVVLVALLLIQGPELALAGPEGAVEPLEKYTTAKAKSLASNYGGQLLEFSGQVYNCLPWLDLRRVGFFKVPRAEDDNRYLSVWIAVDQKDDGVFGAMPRERRVSAMFSRYGVDLLRRLSSMSRVVGDSNVYGLSVAISWIKPGTTNNANSAPVEETLSLFIDKSTVEQFLSKQLPSSVFTERATLNVFDGQSPLGPMPLEVWEDSFNSTYKLSNYEPPAGAKC